MRALLLIALLVAAFAPLHVPAWQFVSVRFLPIAVPLLAAAGLLSVAARSASALKVTAWSGGWGDGDGHLGGDKDRGSDLDGD